MIGRSLRSATWHRIRVSAKTAWIFVVLERHDGLLGCGEATLTGREDGVMAVAPHLSMRALQAPMDDPGDFAAGIVPPDLVHAAVVSALDQARWDLHAQGAGHSVTDMLGPARRGAIAQYANINRRTVIRSPEGFARSAQEALAAGHVAVKMAPFDEVSVAACAAGEGVAAMQPGLARVAAVRDAIGADLRLMVDCHWRFDAATATELVRAAAELGLYWIECPLPEVEQHIGALVRLRSLANDRGIRLAGMEEGIRFDAFRPYCEAGAYDVMMPDVKYVGGLREMLRTAQQFTRHGVAFSPHNPSGPVCHAASMQIACAAGNFDMLEVQFDESPLFASLVGNVFGPVVAGCCPPPPGHGLGAALDASVLAATADQPPVRFEALPA